MPWGHRGEAACGTSAASPLPSPSLARPTIRMGQAVRVGRIALITWNAGLATRGLESRGLGRSRGGDRRRVGPSRLLGRSFFRTRHVAPDAFACGTQGSRGCVVHPVRETVRTDQKFARDWKLSSPLQLNTGATTHACSTRRAAKGDGRGGPGPVCCGHTSWPPRTRRESRRAVCVRPLPVTWWEWPFVLLGKRARSDAIGVTRDVSQRRRSVVIVVKFGGTSLAGTERMWAAARIVAAHRRDQAVVCVVSAMAGGTDALIRTIEQATRGETAWPANVGG